MKIVLLDGALANQMTQFIFARCLEEELGPGGEPVFLDDLWFFCRHGDFGERVERSENHCYQLDKFPHRKKIRLMSEYFSHEVWSELVQQARAKPPLLGGSYLPQLLKDRGCDFFMIAEAPIYQFDGKVARMPYYHYMPEMLKAQGNAYYFGWFTHGGWFMSHEEMFRRELQFEPLQSPEDLKMLRQIEQSTSISVHIRRGSYAASGRATPFAYFKESLRAVLELAASTPERFAKPAHVFVFSDEIGWCREHAAELGLAGLPCPVSYCRDDRGPQDNQCDMQLMAQCDIMVLEYQSVYSYMAALLNQKPNKVVINPNQGRGIF